MITQPLRIQGNKEYIIKNIPVSANILKNKSTLVVDLDLHGLCVLSGDAATLYFQQAASNKENKVILEKYIDNCRDGVQTVTIPLTEFKGLNSSTQVTSLTASFWYPTNYTVDINKISLSNDVLGASTSRDTLRKRHRLSPTPTAQPTTSLSPTITTIPTVTPTPTRVPIPTPTAIVPPTPTGVLHQPWNIQSVSSMKETKDRVCNQRSASFIQQWVNEAANLGVNYIAVETPYDNPSCGNAVAYTTAWVQAIHARGLHVWHRHMPLAFEGIYNTPKNPSIDYLQLISSYIRANPTLFQDGDIFTPIPEPQNGGIQGITYCSNSICIFPSAAGFNQWLRSAMTTSAGAFQQIGLGGRIKIGYFGFDGFVTWGDNNPDWHGILEDATIAQMGNITIDHYPELVGDTMANDLNELQARYPTTPIIIGEWGTVTGGNTVQQVQDSMGAARRTNIVGFNYWHMGVGGNEGLINEDFSHNPQYATVQSFFRSTTP